MKPTLKSLKFTKFSKANLPRLLHSHPEKSTIMVENIMVNMEKDTEKDITKEKVSLEDFSTALKVLVKLLKVPHLMTTPKPKVNLSKFSLLDGFPDLKIFLKLRTHSLQ